jgi:hypothetical protein
VKQKPLHSRVESATNSGGTLRTLGVDANECCEYLGNVHSKS